jgi:2'-5' RNA ligase
MHGLVSLLPKPFYQQVESIWQSLENEMGLCGIRVTPYPHFSWQIADDYEQERLKPILERIASQTKPFPVHTTGMGLFTGPKPVIYISLVKTFELMQFHSMVWESILETSTAASPYYRPGSWMPHISLAYGDVTLENIGEVMKKLAFQNYEWKMQVDNFAFIYEPQGAIGQLRFKIPFA